MPRRNLILAGIVLVALSLTVAACANNPVTPTIQPTPVEPTTVPPTLVPTIPPERTLVVCLVQAGRERKSSKRTEKLKMVKPKSPMMNTAMPS